MNPAVWAEIEDLRNLTTGALKAKYQELFGGETHSSNKQFLLRRIAWRLQARAEGDLSERARRRAAEIADDAEVRLCAPKSVASRLSMGSPPLATRPRPQRDWLLYCQAEDRPVARNELVKGFEYDKDRYVVVEQRELDQIAPASSRVMEVLEFVPAGAVDPVYLDVSVITV